MYFRKLFFKKTNPKTVCRGLAAGASSPRSQEGAAVQNGWLPRAEGLPRLGPSAPRCPGQEASRCRRAVPWEVTPPPVSPTASTLAHLCATTIQHLPLDTHTCLNLRIQSQSHGFLSTFCELTPKSL